MDNLITLDSKDCSKTKTAELEALEIAKKLGLDRQKKFYLLEEGMKKVLSEDLIKRVMDNPERFVRMGEAWYRYWLSGRELRFYYYETGHKLKFLNQCVFGVFRAVKIKDYLAMLPKGALFALDRIADRFEHVYVLDPDVQRLVDPVIFGTIGIEFYEIYWWDKKKE